MIATERITTLTTGSLENDPIGEGFWDISNTSLVCAGGTSLHTSAAEIIDDFDAFWDQLPWEFNSLRKMKQAVSSKPVAAAPRTSSRPSTAASKHIERMETGRELASSLTAFDVTMLLAAEPNVGPPSLPEDIGECVLY